MMANEIYCNRMVLKCHGLQKINCHRYKGKDTKLFYMTNNF